MRTVSRRPWARRGHHLPPVRHRRHLLQYALIDGVIRANPAAAVTRPKVAWEGQKRSVLHPLEFAALLAAARTSGPNDHALVCLLGMLGVRVSEAEIAPGWLHAMRITVAASELRSGWREAAKQRVLIEVPMPSGFEAVSVDVLLGTSTPASIRIERAFLVANMGRGDGGTAAIVARPKHLDARVHEALAPQIAEAVEELRQYGWDGPSTTRIVIFGGDAEGYLREVEIAVDADTHP